jgi:D-glycero-D-manno-heptose 1,7-bisphosphate phosphatase
MEAPGASLPPRSPAHRRAVFVDRDGTINPDLRYLADAQRLEVYRGVAEATRLLHAHGYLVICVTNQSGIERGFYTVEDVERIHARVNEILRREGGGVDAFYYCPHAPETGCQCRKPGTELFLRAAQAFSLDMAAGAIIGDRSLDIEAGERLGLLTVLVPSAGHDGEVQREMQQRGLRADRVALSFRQAVAHVLARG